MTKIVHEVIARTAKELCDSFYEDAARDNLFYRLHPSRKRYVATKWRYFIGYARQVLVTMLSGPYPIQMKEPIYEALVIDGAFKGTPDQGVSLVH